MKKVKQTTKTKIISLHNQLIESYDSIYYLIMNEEEKDSFFLYKIQREVIHIKNLRKALKLSPLK